MDVILGLFILFGLPFIFLWLFLHYRYKMIKAQSGVDDADLKRLAQVQQQTEHLEQRIKTLETILDHRIPDWRRSI